MQAQGKEREVSFTDERQPLIVFYDIELDDAGLDPYQFRIYQRIARRCAGQQKGSCTESLEAMAAACKMSRPTVIRAIKVLIQRGMIRRESRQGSTSFYALTDKKNWIPYAEWEVKYRPEPGKPESRVNNDLVNQRVRGSKPESQGVSTRESGGGSVVYTKNTNEEYKRERETCDSLASLLCELYAVPENAGWHMRDKLQSLAIQLDGLNAKPAEVRAFWEYRSKKPALNYFAGDFTTWRASQPSAKTASGKSSAQTIQAPADYARFYEKRAA